jgi:hyaluronan synthase
MENTETRKISKEGMVRIVFLSIIILMSVLYLIFGAPMVPYRFAEANYGVFLFLLAGFGMLLANLLYFAWQILLAAQYKPYKAPDNPEDLPTCAVIIPAFNEGEQVYHALMSLLKSDYPAHKLDIITVNDGSRDDTWEWMQRAEQESAGRIRALNLTRNGGKRRALYNGFRMTEAEIVVTFDSDSMATPETIRQIVAPFLCDPKAGAVAGNIRVLNTNAGMIPKMLDVSFVFGFEFLRSAQSIVRSVLCTPGALSAYRRKAIMPHMQEWVNEKFFGKPANIGEDRAITNILLREGWGVVFQQTSTVYTEMPLTYSGLCKMLIRWGRSNVRENIAMAKFAFRRFDTSDDDLTGMQVNLVMQTFWMAAPVIFLGYTVYCLLQGVLPFIIGAAFAIIFWSTMPAFVYARRYNAGDSVWSYVYGIFSFFTLFWVSPYCIFTVHKSGWLTRQKPKAAEQEIQKDTVTNGSNLPKISHS